MPIKPEIAPKMVKGAVKERGETYDVTKISSRGEAQEEKGQSSDTPVVISGDAPKAKLRGLGTFDRPRTSRHPRSLADIEIIYH